MIQRDVGKYGQSYIVLQAHISNFTFLVQARSDIFFFFFGWMDVVACRIPFSHELTVHHAGLHYWTNLQPM